MLFIPASQIKTIRGQSKKYLLFFLMALFVHLGVWYHAKDKQASWLNVPPAPSPEGLAVLGLGDQQFSLRIMGLTLQNLGDHGGRVTNFTEYNYERLRDWFKTSYAVDKKSNYFPMLAAYFYSGTRNTAQLKYIIDYLEVVGNKAPREQWRWLAQAVFLARFRMKDMDRALELAYKLAALDHPDMPSWTDQMPAFVLNARGEKQSARDIIETILLSDLENLHPNEVNYMCAYIREQIAEGDTETIYKNNEVQTLCNAAP